MRKLLRWLGFAMVSFGIVCFPFAIWFPGPWGVISLVLVMGGCFVLVGAMRGAPEDGDSDGSSDIGQPPRSPE